MSALIIAFPQHRTRAPGALPAGVRVDYLARFRAIMAHAVNGETGLPMTETELDACSHRLMAGVEAARSELLHKR